MPWCAYKFAQDVARVRVGFMKILGLTTGGWVDIHVACRALNSITRCQISYMYAICTDEITCSKLSGLRLWMVSPSATNSQHDFR